MNKKAIVSSIQAFNIQHLLFGVITLAENISKETKESQVVREAGVECLCLKAVPLTVFDISFHIYTVNKNSYGRL